VHLLVKRILNVIKMHGTTIKIKFHIAIEYFDTPPQIAMNKQGRSMGPDCV
jgi:hypothetical protein